MTKEEFEALQAKKREFEADIARLRMDNEMSRLGDVSSVKGFSIDAYRKANQVQIFFNRDSQESILLLRAYYKGEFTLSPSFSVGSFGKDITELMNGMGGLWRSGLKAFSRSANQYTGGSSFKSEMTGAFSMPLKPYIKGTEPLSFTINAFLPLIQRGDGTDSFEENIERPLNDLLGIALPWKQKEASEGIAKVNKWVDSAIDWLFKPYDESSFWKSVNTGVKSMKEDFFGGIYMLSTPLQFAGDNSITVRIGAWRIPKCIIDSVSVTYSPMIYSDGSRFYPSYANVAIKVSTLEAVTPDLLGVYDKMSSKLKSCIDPAFVKNQG